MFLLGSAIAFPDTHHLQLSATFFTIHVMPILIFIPYFIGQISIP